MRPRLLLILLLAILLGLASGIAAYGYAAGHRTSATAQGDISADFDSLL